MSARMEYHLRGQREAVRRDFTRTTRLWVKCVRCGCSWSWSGPTENVGDGEASIEASSCYCHPAWRTR